MSDSDLPWIKAADAASSAERRWRGELGEAIRAFGPLVWPGVPATALQSFTMNGQQTENTGVLRTSSGALVNPYFHEIGYFQTPAGPSSGPAPNPDQGAAHNSYGRLGRDPRVLALGVTPDLRPDAWKTRVRDQTAIGLFDFLEEGRRVAAQVPSLAPSSWSTPWAFALAVMGYVVGAGAATTALRGIEGELRAVAERDRVDAFVRAAAANPTYERGYAALRVWQRLEYGRKLAELVGESQGWYPTIVPGPERTAVASVLIAARERRAPAPLATRGTYERRTSAFGGALIAVSVGAFAYFAARALERRGAFDRPRRWVRGALAGK